MDTESRGTLMRKISHEPDAVRQALEAGGRRCTSQRMAVYSYLSEADWHPTAEEVYHGVKTTIPNISLATVYKALEAIVASGLASKLTAGDGAARYDARSDHHYHLRCLRSGMVQNLPTPHDPELIAKLDPGLQDRLAAQGFHLTGYRLELVGYFDGGSFTRTPLAADGSPGTGKR